MMSLPWLWIDLLELNLVRGNGFAVFVEDEESSASRALVDGAYENFF